MPQVIYAPAALRDLHRLREFLRSKSPAASKRATETIIEAIKVLEHQPHIGRPVDDMPDEYREWLINFGNSGYVARYQFEGRDITILAIRHQREVGYGEYEKKD